MNLGTTAIVALAVSEDGCQVGEPDPVSRVFLAAMTLVVIVVLILTRRWK